MTLRTEYIGVKTQPPDQASTAFASSFTEHYDEIAAKYPVFDELREYAKLVALAQFLKEKRAPILWYLLANKDMILTEDSIGVVDALTKKSEYVEHLTIQGGVELARSRDHACYILDDQAAAALEQARANRQVDSPATAWHFNIDSKGGKQTPFTVTSSSEVTLTSGAAGGERVQTDLSFWKDSQPLIDFARYYDPSYEGTATFGRGWHLLIPYRLEPLWDARVEFASAVVPERFRIRNLVTGTEETLTFSKDRLAIAGYVPERGNDSALIGLFWFNDQSLRLADKLGAEFQFDPEYRLTTMTLAEGYTVHFEYGVETASALRFDRPPYRLEVLGSDVEETGPIVLPKRLQVLDSDGNAEVALVFSKDNPHGLVGYVPDGDSRHPWQFMAVLNDGSFVLEDSDGTQVAFDGAGNLEEIRTRVVRSMRRDDAQANFDYEFADGMHRISRATVRLDGTDNKVLYGYSREGTLSRVYLPSGQNLDITYRPDQWGAVTVCTTSVAGFSQ